MTRRRQLVGLATLLVLFGLGRGVSRAPHATGSPENVLLVTIDTLRADHVGAWGCATCSTPNLDALAASGLRFERAQSAAPLTGPSHATILTGLYPPQHGVRDNVSYPLADRGFSLASRLQQDGYRTGAFVSGYPVARAFGFGQGFDDFDERLHAAAEPGHGAERPAVEVADAALAWLGRSDARPFFAWLHFYDAHAPYTPPEPFASRFAASPYDGEIASVDAQLGRVIAALRADGRLARTLVVVTADHGESLGEHGEKAHAVLVYEAVLHVPLIAAGPGIAPHGVVSSRVGTVDIVPSVLGYLRRAAGDVAGRDLRLRDGGTGRSAQDALYAESLFGRLNCGWASLRTLTQGDRKLIAGAEPELYDLAADPGESRDLARERPAEVARQLQALRGAVGRLAPSGDRATAIALSPEQEEALRSLGYAGGGGAAGDLDAPGLPDPRGRVDVYEQLQAALTYEGPDFPRALSDLQRLVARDSSNPFGQFVLAAVAWRAHRPEVADAAFQATLRLDPERPGRRYHYGRFLRETGRLEASEHELRLAVAQTTADDARTRLALAKTLALRGASGEAEAIARGVLERQPQDSEAAALVGHALAARGATEEALVYYRIGTRGPDAEPWIEVAELHLASGDAGRAEAAIRHALERSPAHPEALAVLARVELALGRKAEASATLRKALRVGPRTVEAWQRLAQAFEAAGELRLARQCRLRAADGGKG